MKPRRGLALAAGIAGIALLLLVLAAALVMQPQRLARLVLGGVGDGLGLEITFEGQARYRLRGTPMLEVHAVAVRRPGEAEPLLRASRVLVALPWSSLRTRAEPLALERIELDAPVLDLPRLQAWLALRPTGGGGLPSLSEGVTVRDGRVLADGWEVRDLQLRLPGFRADAPLAAHARGSLFLASPARIHFDLQLAASRPANGTGIGVQGRVNVEHADWSLPAYVTASGPLRIADGRVHVTPLRFGAHAEFRGHGEPLAFALGAHGPLRLRNGTWTLVPLALALRGDGVVPVFDAGGRAALGPALLLELEGAMADWPEAWPALPAPLGASTSALAFSLGYAGASDLADPARLHLSRDRAHADIDARTFEVLDWMDAAASGSPLPPLRARASAPRIEVPGGTLHGLEISIEPGDPQ